MSLPWSHSRRFPPHIRKLIHKRAGRRCESVDDNGRCVNPSAVADHITPVAEGGTDHIDNGQALCDPHHWKKTMTEQARGRARHARKRPHGQHPGMR